MVYSWSKDLIVFIRLNIGRVYMFSCLFQWCWNCCLYCILPHLFHLSKTKNTQLDNYNLDSSLIISIGFVSVSLSSVTFHSMLWQMAGSSVYNTHWCKDFIYSPISVCIIVFMHSLLSAICDFRYIHYVTLFKKIYYHHQCKSWM